MGGTLGLLRVLRDAGLVDAHLDEDEVVRLLGPGLNKNLGSLF